MSISSLIKQIHEVADSPPAPDSLSSEERMSLLAGLDKLRGAIETPIDAVTRIVFGAYEQVAVRLGIDMGIFNTLAAVAPTGELTTDEIAQKTGADPLLVSRVLRLLGGMGLFKEAGENKYANGPLAPAFADGSPLPHAVLHIATGSEVLVKLPEYLRKTQYKNPEASRDGPFQYAMNTKLHFFDWLKNDSAQAAAFATVMMIQRMDRGEAWFDFFPVEQKLGKQMSAGQEAPLLVDVGGNIGNDIAAFHAKFPTLPGKLILEELPEVIDSIKELPDAILPVKHDFFMPQPDLAKGAKAYFLSTIIHDWPDKEAKVILANIRDAMTKDSILLINENALPDTNVPLYPAKLDFLMMCLFSSADRTVKQFKKLLDESGFELVQIYQPKVVRPGTGYLFEAVLK